MFKVAVITLSDRASEGVYEDKSGPAVREMLGDEYEVTETILLGDDYEKLREELIRLSDKVKIDLILTTGGTGFSPRDVTPEATRSVSHRDAPGISEMMRAQSMKYTPRAALSRGVSVIRGKTLIINLPGSPRAVRENMECVKEILPHALQLLNGEKADS